VHAHPLSLYLPICTKLWCKLQLRGQINTPSIFLLYPYMFSVVERMNLVVVVVWGGGIRDICGLLVSPKYYKRLKIVISTLVEIKG
jgi:hypothetical protein